MYNKRDVDCKTEKYIHRLESDEFYQTMTNNICIEPEIRPEESKFCKIDLKSNRVFEGLVEYIEDSDIQVDLKSLRIFDGLVEYIEDTGIMWRLKLLNGRMIWMNSMISQKKCTIENNSSW